MARQTRRRFDPVRTEELGIDELLVENAAARSDYFSVWPAEERPEKCPYCDGTSFKVQDRFSREYTDVLPGAQNPKIISLLYNFHKYRCLNPDCRHIFAADINFASVNDNVTHRLEDRIAEMIIGGASYGAIADAFQGKLSRQAVGQIFNRWVRQKRENTALYATPSVLAILTGHTHRGEYTVILSCGEKLRVLDILYGIDSDGIAAALQPFTTHPPRIVLTDCDPIVYAAVKDAFPTTAHIIPAEMWLKLVRDDFAALAAEQLRWVTIPDKVGKVLATGAADEENMTIDLKNIFIARPEIKKPYRDYHELRRLITDRDFRWSIEELDEWPQHIDSAFHTQLSATLVQYREYRKEIALHQEYGEQVSTGLLSATDRLEDALKERRTFSTQVLQAAVLYSTENDPQGVDIEKVITKLLSLQQGSRRKHYDYE